MGLSPGLSIGDPPIPRAAAWPFSQTKGRT